MRDRKAKPQKNYSFNTAIKRTRPSLPLRNLLNNKSISGNVLDYGCGKGFDAEYLGNLGYSVDSYDPYWKPDGIKKQSYNSIVCSYVLNVLKTDEEILAVIRKAASLLSKDGKAYFSVRRDVKKSGFTSRGFQRNVVLSAPVLYEKSGSFCTYIIDKKIVASDSIRVMCG